MSEAVSFWLDNKMASARKVAEIGSQVLVDYRGKFYVVVNGSAQMRGSKPLHYSRSSMPSLWKKALRGESPPPPPDDQDDASMPIPSKTRITRSRSGKEAPSMTATIPVAETAPVARQPVSADKAVRPVKKTETIKLAHQTTVPAQCPYCSQKHDIPVEKGKNGKPFFVTCSKCTADFAVRFTPVTMFQAQVAGFRLP